MNQNTIVTGTIKELAGQIELKGLDGKTRVLSAAQISNLAGLGFLVLDSKIPQPLGADGKQGKGKPTNVWAVPAELSLAALVVTASAEAEAIVDDAADAPEAAETPTVDPDTTVTEGEEAVEA